MTGLRDTTERRSESSATRRHPRKRSSSAASPTLEATIAENPSESARRSSGSELQNAQWNAAHREQNREAQNRVETAVAADIARTAAAAHTRTAAGDAAAADERAVRAGFDVLRAANKLGAVLLQFPFSFHRTKETVAHLSAVLRRFADYPLVVEVRHGTWNSPETLALLREHGAGFCNIDQPIIGRSLAPSAQATSAVGYIRLHGRRYDTWFTDDATIPAHERYNYLYSAEELDPWIARIRKVAEHARDTFVVTNNHFQGKAVVNALQLISILKDTKIKVPEPLRQRYTQLDSIADTPPAEPTLFPIER